MTAKITSYNIHSVLAKLVARDYQRTPCAICSAHLDLPAKIRCFVIPASAVNSFAIPWNKAEFQAATHDSIDAEAFLFKNNMLLYKIKFHYIEDYFRGPEGSPVCNGILLDWKNLMASELDTLQHPRSYDGSPPTERTALLDFYNDHGLYLK